MSKRIKGPDGQVIEFPDNMSDSDIVSVMQKHYGAPTEPELDQYQKAAQEDLAFAKEIGREDGVGRRFLQGGTFGFADELLAGAQTPIEMIRRGTINPAEGYRYAKAREDALLQDARDNTGALGTAAEIAGGVITGSPIRGASPAPTSVLQNIGQTAKAGATYGAIAGAGEGSGVTDRLGRALVGGTIGGVVGGAIPAASAALSGPMSAVRAMINPRGVAENQMGRILAESGRSADDVANAVRQAAQEGQGVYTVADDLGNAGQRALSTVTRAPGAGRQQAVEFLEQRQAGQGSRVGDILDEGLGATKTAAALKAQQEAARRAEADALYGAARDEAVPVDVSGALQIADDFLRPGVNKVANPGSGIADDSVEGAVRRARSFLSDGRSNLTDFDSVLRAKVEIQNLIDKSSPSVQRVLTPLRNAVDDALERAAPSTYGAARNAYRSASKGIEAIDTGRAMAARGRPDDTIAAYRGMAQNEQAGARTGYANTLLEKVERSPTGTNVVRPLTAEKYQREIAELSGPNAQDVARKLAREQTMFETRGQALGGSRTADNLADAETMGVDPGILAALFSGNVMSAGGQAFRRAMTNLSGYTPAVREELAGMLLQRGLDPKIVQTLDRVMQRNMKARLAVVRFLGGSFGGAAATPGALQGNAQPSR